ncbi:HNH endonuclease [Nesterenkonia sp. MY13]|uniref:HNH endonuclease n=1 Tax=Nesterenkonia sedimenti TaxID=1463632 RepID=A0A7X8THS1_9MICC|nr:HNH endonuclease signature motif containing protein [Nesterenkonia sedimenti]NLS08961.1 HNH endonuclease [Nesterenkonia sedimenti]
MKDEQQFPRPEIPERASHLIGDEELEAAWESIIDANRATAASIEHFLTHRGTRWKETMGENPHVRAANNRQANRHAGLLLGMSDQQATAVLNAAEYVREHLPKFWKAFRCGAIALTNLRKAAVETLPLIHRDDLLEIIDEELVDIAPGKTPTELRSWIIRRIPELDMELFNEAAEDAKDRRSVTFTHFGEGMSLVELFIPTIEAKAIEKKVNAAARGMNRAQPKDTDQPPAFAAAGVPTDRLRPHQVAEGPHPAAVGMGETMPVDHDARYQDHDPENTTGGVDDRTIRQREADLLSAWLRDGHCYSAPISAKICVMVPQETLTGESEEPAISADRATVILASDIRKVAADPEAEHEWYTAGTRTNQRRADRDILSIVYNGRFAPERLRDAIIFRDGICQATGCTIPAERSDLDHQIPYERAGPTSGSNLWALCRRHHRLKSHGYLPPPNADPPALGEGSEETRPAAA